MSSALPRPLHERVAELVEAALRSPWITVEEWCVRTGDTREAVYTRRQRGIWRDEVECSKPAGGGLWVNVEKANAWVAKSGSRRASQSDEAGKASPSPSG